MPRELWVSVDADTPPFHHLVEFAQSHGIVVRHFRAGNTMPWDDTVIRVLSPLREYQPQNVPTNEDSLALEVQYGDAEHASENNIIGEQTGPVTLLKVDHHGSTTSTSAAFLAAVHPRCAIISCGLGNRFGHPRMPVLHRLQAAGVLTSRTDRMGAVQYLLHSNGSIETHVLTSHP